MDKNTENNKCTLISTVVQLDETNIHTVIQIRLHIHINYIIQQESHYSDAKISATAELAVKC